MKELLVASRNAKKLVELKTLLAQLGYEVMSLAEIDPDSEVEIVEDGLSFAENALIKARTAADACGILSLGEDSGLVVEALGGAPGIYSARYLRLTTGELRLPYPDYPGGDPLAVRGVTDDDLNNLRLLFELEGRDNRAAHYRSAVAVVDGAGKELCAFVGDVHGTITHRHDGDGGFGYDPLFTPANHDRTFARMTADEKHALSHRGKALAQLVEFLGEKV
ncbi:RdgB/HAM1 family non-canonical purine NTP pyrophosphatase [bacterium]|nr:RdgB/HAM1 family non-canonical purine NTP pyrophosphatase [bacterium]